MPIHDSIVGCILGTAVGDALGLPCERLTRERQRKLYPKLDGPRFIFGRGVLSDDTEHTCLVAQALIASGGENGQFGRELARQLRNWFLTLPPGTGMATLKSCFRLCLGVSPERSGVYSAGNGPAMRSALLGVCCEGDYDCLREWNRISTRVTHTDPKAEAGAFAVALAAYFEAHRPERTPHEYVEALLAHGPQGDALSQMGELARQALGSANTGENADAFAEKIGSKQGVSGYIFHTVPVVLQVWFKGGDYRTAVTEIVRCGGDADSTAAILGAIIGARGRDVVPTAWIDQLGDWPRSVSWMEQLASQLAEVQESKQGHKAPTLFYPLLLVRNIVFFAAILVHIGRRMLPPY
jgi:ADP-ribosyl-[dinitrogen reductase] hydrolase